MIIKISNNPIDGGAPGWISRYLCSKSSISRNDDDDGQVDSTVLGKDDMLFFGLLLLPCWVGAIERRLRRRRRGTEKEERTSTFFPPSKSGAERGETTKCLEN